MKKTVFLVSLVFLLVVSGCENNGGYAPYGNQDSYVAEGGIDWDFYNERATAFITAAASGDFDVAASMFGEAVARVFGVNDLQEAWEEIISLAGEFVAIHEIHNAAADEHYISGVIMRHENLGFGWNIIFSEDGLIAGLRSGGTLALPGEISTQPLTPALREGFTDIPVIVGENTDFPLNGILSMPDNATEAVPAVVLVHGSGVLNMDLALPAPENPMNRIFYDIANYLAADGIAVLRYDKRNFAHESAGVFGNTVWDETIEDAILAAELLRAQPGIDPNRVFMAGLSLGGVVAPRTHVHGGGFAGLIIMNGSPRTLFEMSTEQSRLSFEIPGIAETVLPQQQQGVQALLDDGNIDALRAAFHFCSNTADEEVMAFAVGFAGAEPADAMEMYLDNRKRIQASMPYMTDEEARAMIFDPISGVTMYYFRDLELNPTPEYLARTDIPMLILQGGNDFQVLADVDFALYKELLGERDDVDFILYPALNHLLMPSAAANIMEAMAELGAAGHIYPQVPQDIAEWIHSR